MLINENKRIIGLSTFNDNFFCSRCFVSLVHPNKGYFLNKRRFIIKKSFLCDNCSKHSLSFFKCVLCQTIYKNGELFLVACMKCLNYTNKENYQNLPLRVKDEIFLLILCIHHNYKGGRKFEKKLIDLMIIEIIKIKKKRNLNTISKLKFI